MAAVGDTGQRELIGRLGIGLAGSKPAKLAENPRLRLVVEAKLEDWWSPRQISEWLTEAYPDDEGMRVSHETIYQSLFMHDRPGLHFAG